jgi:putative spermidine/putrescine transport system ATP-binding protein
VAHTSPPGARLEVKEVVHVYAGAPALDGVGFAVEAGEIVALLGPSGCGKSTMLRVIAGLVKPARGVVRLGGRDLGPIAARDRRIGLVFQSYALFPHMTVAENIGYGLAHLPRAERRSRIAEMLSVVQLDAYSERLPRELSGGQQQRVAVARALAPRPALLLLDEPFGALDRALRADLQLGFVKLQRELGITTILVTHDQEEAQAVADRIAVMRSGRIEQFDTATEVYDNPATLFVNRFVGQASVLSATVLEDGPQSALLQLPTGERLVLPRQASFRAGSPVVVTLRPEDVRLADRAEPGAIAVDRLLSTPQGAHMVHSLVLADGTPLAALESRDRRAPPPPGRMAAFAVPDMRRCRLFAATEASEAEGSPT